MNAEFQNLKVERRRELKALAKVLKENGFELPFKLRRWNFDRLRKSLEFFKANYQTDINHWSDLASLEGIDERTRMMLLEWVERRAFIISVFEKFLKLLH